MKIIGIDTETTGLKWDKGDRIIELSMISCELGGGKFGFTDKFTQRVNPQRPIHPDAIAVHGIKDSDVAICETFDKYADEVAGRMADADLLVAHNMGFDGPFIATELMKAGVTMPGTKTFCTMENGRWATATGKFPSLRELCFSLAVNYDPEKAHAAEYDVFVTLMCLVKGAQRGFYKL